MVTVSSMKICLHSSLISLVLAALVSLVVCVLGTGNVTGGAVVSTGKASSHDSTYPPAHRVASSRPLSDGSYNIVNDEKWYVKGTSPQNNDEEINATYGGKITRLGQYWYLLGTERVEGTALDIVNIYKSASLGSDSWEYVRSIIPTNFLKNGRSFRNCQINQHPTLKSHHILCKNRNYFIGEDGILGNFRYLLPKPKDPSPLAGSFGDTSFFSQGDQMYEVVSSCDKSSGKCEVGSRTLFIYLLNDEWADYHSTRPVVISFHWPRREAPFIANYGEWFFLLASETAGWKQSRTWYRRAKSLQALANSTEYEVVMHPRNTRSIKSMGSQFRFLLEIVPGKWMFAGDRYPANDKVHWDPKYGAHVMTPLQFVSDVPHVYWKKEFNWVTYNYGSADYDAHYHDGRGHSPPGFAHSLQLKVESLMLNATAKRWS